MTVQLAEASSPPKFYFGLRPLVIIDDAKFGLKMGTDSKSTPVANQSVFSSSSASAPASSSASSSASAGAQSDSDDDEVTAIFAGHHAKRRMTAELKDLLQKTYGAANQDIASCTDDEVNDLYGFGTTLTSGREPRGSTYENHYKGKFRTQASIAIAELMFSKTPAWDFTETSNSGQTVYTFSKTNWDTKGTLL